MKLRIRRAAFIGAVTAIALAVAGCGSSGNPLETSSQQSAGGAGSAAGGAGSAAGGAETTAAGNSTAASTGASAGGSGGAGGSAGAATEASGAGSSGAASSGGGGGTGAPIVIGSADFTESVTIAEIYAAALNAKGITASTKPRLGAREVYIPALEDGSINVVPEYTGVALQYFDKKATPTDPDATYAALKKALPAGLTVLDMAPAQDKDSLTVTKATADRLGLKTIEDLKGKSQDMVIGGPAEWETRMTGIPGFKKIYGLTFKSFEKTDAGGPITIKALTTGIIQAGNVFTTDAAIAKNNLVSLQDTKDMFGAQNVVPLIAKSAVTPEVTETLNAVSAKLTTEDLLKLNDQVSNQHLDSATVAKQWLADKGLG